MGLIQRSDFNLACHIRACLVRGVSRADDEGIHCRPVWKLINKPTNRSTDIYSSVAVPTEDASRAAITDRNELFNKSSSMIHQSSFALIYWFISFPLFLCPNLPFCSPHTYPLSAPSPSTPFLHPLHLTAVLLFHKELKVDWQVHIVRGEQCPCKGKVMVTSEFSFRPHGVCKKVKEATVTSIFKTIVLEIRKQFSPGPWMQ